MKDPVCGMEVAPERAAGHEPNEGTTYYFCSAGCLAKFRADPARYVAAGKPQGRGAATPVASAPAAPLPSAGAAEWTCPMHPQVIRSGPGTCPICGMALEPRTVTLDDGPNHELADMTRRFWIGVALSAPLVLMMLGDLLPGRPLHMFLGRARMWIEMALATPVVLWAGAPFFVRMWQ